MAQASRDLRDADLTQNFDEQYAADWILCSDSIEFTQIIDLFPSFSGTDLN